MLVCAGLERECRCSMASSDESCGQTRFKIRSWHFARSFSLQVPNSCTDLDRTVLCISIAGTYSKFVREDKMLALGVCFPQPWLELNKTLWGLNQNEFCKIDPKDPTASYTTFCFKCLIDFFFVRGPGT